MDNKYCLASDSEEIILQEKTFTYWASSDMLKVRSNFSFQKKLKEPIRGKSVDYTINFTIDFNYNKHNDIYYIYLTDEEDYISLDKDLFSALNLRDSLTKESVMINHALHRIHDNKVW